MAYDARLAERIRLILSDRDDLSERKMFGGVAFMLHGNMCIGVNGDELMVRVGPDRYGKAVQRKHAREMDFTGRALKGFVYVSAAGVGSRAALTSWIEAGVAFADRLPPK